jgi:hypothetical protein
MYSFRNIRNAHLLRAMRKNTDRQRLHKIYLRAKNTLRDHHQDSYALMLERHAQELDKLWADYNLAVKKLAAEHNSKSVKSSLEKSVPIKKRRVPGIVLEEAVIH